MQNQFIFSPTPTASSSDTISTNTPTITPDSTEQQPILRPKNHIIPADTVELLRDGEGIADNSKTTHPVPIMFVTNAAGVEQKHSDSEQETSPAAAFLANFMSTNQEQEQYTDNSHHRDIIADYILLDHIGFGGNSIVRRARHKLTGDIFAIKIIETEIISSSSSDTEQQLFTPTVMKSQQQQLVQARLERELSIWRSLVHPNIVRLIKTFHVPHEQTYYIVNEYCSGGDLLTYRKSKPTMSEREMKVIFRQVCEGVRYLHKERNVCHKDLKLENILLWQPTSAEECEGRQDKEDLFMQVKICDFGLSMYTNNNNSSCCCGIMDKPTSKDRLHVKEQDETTAQVEDEAAGGSLAYIPPEQIRRKKTSLACRKTDIWSLGVILYTLAVGQLPFVNTFELKLQEMILEGDYNIPENKHLSSSLHQLIKGCLAYLPENRLDIDQILSSEWLSNA